MYVYMYMYVYIYRALISNCAKYYITLYTLLELVHHYDLGRERWSMIEVGRGKEGSDVGYLTRQGPGARRI